MSFLYLFQKLSPISRNLFILSTNQFHNLKYFQKNTIIHINNRFSRFSTLVGNKVREDIDIFAKLDLNFTEQQRVNKNDLEIAINEFKHKDVVYGEYAQYLIQYCGHSIPDTLPDERLFLAKEIWETYNSRKINLSVDFYNALIRCFIENEMALSYQEFLKTMKCDPNEETYQLLLKCACERGDIKQATEIINIMKKSGYSANEPVFSSLILAHLRSGDIKNAKNTLSTMKLAMLNPTALTYTELLRGFAELNDEVNFKKYLTEATVNTNLNLNSIISVIRSICQSKNLHFLPVVKEAFPDVISTRKFQIYITNLCVNLIHLDKPNIAYQTFKSFIEPEIGFLTESDSYASSLISEMVKVNTDSSKIVAVLDDLVQTKRNESAFLKALFYSLKRLNIDLALFLLQNLHSQNVVLRNHYFWPILIYASKISQEEMFKIFKIMCDMNLRIDNETLETYSLQYLKNLEPSFMIEKLKDFGLKVKEVVTPIAVILLRTNRLEEVVKTCKEYKIKLNGDHIIKPLSSSFFLTYDVKNTVDILKCINNGKNSEKYNGQLLIYLFNKPKIDYKQILKLLKEMQINKMTISSYSMDKIDYLSSKIEDNHIRVNILQIVNSIVNYSNINDNTTNIPHPRDMNLEQLECHLIELNSKKMETRGILRKLIQLHCRLGNEKRVTELLEEFNKAKYKLSTGIKAGLMDLYIKSRNLQMTKKYYEDIIKNDPSFIVDEFKIIDLANLLVNDEKFIEALNLIEAESQKRTIRGTKTIEPNCWRLLNSIAIKGDENNTKIFFDKLTERGFCTPNNIILGPLIRVHLKNENIVNAVKNYVHCCEKYKCTPLQHELLVYLVKNNTSMDLVEQVLKYTGKVHGNNSAKVALAAALATAGKIDTLKDFLLELKEDLSPEILEQHCHHWVKESNPEPLENLYKVHNLLSVRNRENICQNLMNIYYASNDYESALKLKNKLQEQDYPTTEKMKNQISTLLKNNENIVS